MKTVVFIFAVAISLVSASGQGTLNFNNTGTDPVTNIRVKAAIFNIDGITPLSGGNYYAGLFAGSDEGSMTLLGAAVPFRTGIAAGFVKVGTAGAREVPGVVPGGDTLVQVRAWQ